MTEDLRHWQPRPRPERVVLEGRYVRLEPIEATAHGEGLFTASAVPDAEGKFAFLAEDPPTTRENFLAWVERAARSADPVFFAVVDKTSGEVAGRQSLMRIDAANGTIEIGNIYWGPLISRRPGATEAQFLFMKYVFDELGYRRYEWKCNNLNEPSKRAARRFGFQPEGLFRQHLVVKGKNRDTAWFSIIDKEWPALRDAYEGWLDASNFDADGRQIRRLEAFR
jgi:RimJ/RimL family protein N-acetyltransferase